MAKKRVPQLSRIVARAKKKPAPKRKSKDIVSDDLRKIRRQIKDLLLADTQLKACIAALEAWRESLGLVGWPGPAVEAPVSARTGLVLDHVEQD